MSSWPLSQDYNEAIQSPKSNFADPELRCGEAVANALGLPMPYSGNFADVYRCAAPTAAAGPSSASPARPRTARTLPGDQPPSAPGEIALHRGLHLPGAGHPCGRRMVSRPEDGMGEGLTLNQFVGKYADKPALLEALLRNCGPHGALCAPPGWGTATCNTATCSWPGRPHERAGPEADRLRRHVGAGLGRNEVGRSRPRLLPAPATTARAELHHRRGSFSGAADRHGACGR